MDGFYMPAPLRVEGMRSDLHRVPHSQGDGVANASFKTTSKSATV